MSFDSRLNSLKLLLDLYEKIITEHKNTKKELEETNNKLDIIIHENENLKKENERLQNDISILHNFNDSLMQFGCVKEYIKNNINIMDELDN